jgi:hypothetical protein
MEQISWLPEDMIEPVLGPEGFQRPFPPHAAGDPMEDDLFAALRDPDGRVR